MLRDDSRPRQVSGIVARCFLPVDFTMHQLERDSIVRETLTNLREKTLSVVSEAFLETNYTALLVHARIPRCESQVKP